MSDSQQKENRITFYWKYNEKGERFLTFGKMQGSPDGKELTVILADRPEKGRERKAAADIFPVFQQKAGTYGAYSEYMTRHGCACCSLTTILAACVQDYRSLRPEETIVRVEKNHFGQKVWDKNYRRHIARQMPVSLYGISQILSDYRIPHRYIGDFTDAAAVIQIRRHLRTGRPVIIETSRMKRRNGRIVRWFDRRFAGSYHTMILLGEDEKGQIIFTDSATREWAGKFQRIKKAELSELIAYMFPQKNTADTHVYFSRRRNTGGYILVDQTGQELSI